MVVDRSFVSAIIATYNRAYIVGEAIESILNQTYKNIELIVVDDGSTDNTREVLTQYGDQIRVVYQGNSGPAAAWNRGIRESRGSIITFLGSDDVWLPTFVERQVSLLHRAGRSVPCCLANGLLRFANGSQTTSFELASLHPDCKEGLWLNVTEMLATRFVMCGQLIAIRREALQRIGGFDPSLRYLEDYDIGLRLSLEGPWGFIRDPLVVYRQSAADSLSLKISSEDPRIHQYMLKIRERVVDTMYERRRTSSFRLLRAAARKTRRDLWFSRLAARQSFLSQALVWSYRFAEHYRLAVYARLPWFPKMQVSPAEAAKPQ
jgi:glycosyltransferase involved in cell wall biosynthesis